MPVPTLCDHGRSTLQLAVLLAAVTLCAGCACVFRPNTPTPASTAAVVAPPADPPSQVVRNGRYTLVELVPDNTQRDLLLQIVDVRIPTTMTATVGEALRYVLLRSGYQLCEDEEVRSLDSLPLPAAHMQLGPLTLRDALQVLVGPAWGAQVDDAARQICFARHAAISFPMDISALSDAAHVEAPSPSTSTPEPQP